MKEIEEIQGLNFQHNIYVIQNRNNSITYEPADVGVMSIAKRTSKLLLQNQGNSDIERIYYLAKRDDVKFNVIEIPDSFLANGSTDFDTEYMKKLIKVGEDIAKNGNFWFNKPSSIRANLP